MQQPDSEEHQQAPYRVDDVIADVYHAATGNRPWGKVLTAISAMLGVKGCQMIGFSTVNGAAQFSHASADVAVETELEYARTYHVVDPRVPSLMANPVGQWLYDEDLFDTETALASSYYRDFLIPYGSRFTATTRLFDDEGTVVFIGFLMGLDGSGFTIQQREFLRSLAVHLREALVIYQKWRKLTTAAWTGTELLRRMARPAILLNTDCGITFMNALAKEYIEQTGALLLVRDRLVSFDKESDLSLDRAFVEMLRDIDAGGVPERRVVRLAGARSRFATALSLTAFVPSESLYTFGNQAQVMLIVHEQARQAAPDLMLWEAAFDLTPAQARVALELFMGHTVAQTAGSLQVAQTTVRSHVKELLAKTGTSRQAQMLVALGNLQAI